MKLRKGLVFAVAAICSGAGFSYAAEPNLGEYPAPGPNERIWVIQLPHIENEPLSMVQILPGEVVQKDCNLFTLGGKVEKQVDPGSTHEYYRVTQLGSVATTRMACLDGHTELAYVPSYAASITVPYNSYEPVVLYAPANTVVKYRVFTTDDEMFDVPGPAVAQ